MKKIFTLLALLSILLTAGYSRAEDGNTIYQSETLIVRKLSEHVYLHISYLNTQSFGRVSCNGMVVTDGSEAVVFDTTCDDESSAELIGWITNSLGSTVTAVVPTHYHDDNLGGLNEFHRQGIPSYALQETIRIAEENGYPEPQNGFDNFTELTVGGKTVYADFLGGGHTRDNVIGYFPAENIMFGGCLVKATGADKGNLAEACVDEWSETVRRVKQKYPDVTLIIPGHGEAGGTELLDYTELLFE